MIQKRIVGLALMMVLALALVVSVACGGDDDDGQAVPTAPAGAIRVELVNWAVEPSATSAKAGDVTFYAIHDKGHAHSDDEGGVIHDLQVMRKRADGSMELVGQVTGLKMGEAQSLTLNLSAGDYELSCNVVEEMGGTVIPHYAKGMRTPFKVTG